MFLFQVRSVLFSLWCESGSIFQCLGGKWERIGFIFSVFILTEAYRGGWGEFPIGLLWCESFGKLGDWKEYTAHNFSTFLACGTSIDPVRPNSNTSFLGSFPWFSPCLTVIFVVTQYLCRFSLWWLSYYSHCFLHKKHCVLSLKAGQITLHIPGI